MLLQYFCLDLPSAKLGTRSLKHLGGLGGVLKGEDIFLRVPAGFTHHGAPLSQFFIPPCPITGARTELLGAFANPVR